jgi:hypothetical protein
MTRSGSMQRLSACLNDSPLAFAMSAPGPFKSISIADPSTASEKAARLVMAACNVCDSLLPLGEASLGQIGFDEWFRRSRSAA